MVVTDERHIATGQDRLHCGILDAVVINDSAHFKIIGHYDTVVLQVLTKEFPNDRRG